MFSVPGQFVAWIPALICAWGILKWRRWAQFLTVVLLALGILLQAAEFATLGAQHHRGTSKLLAIMGALLMIIWLLLPRVRLQFKD